MEEFVEGYLSIGQVLRPQGLKGLVKIRPDTDDPGRFSLLDTVYVQGKKGHMDSIPISEVSVRGGFVYLRLGEDDSVEAAQARRDTLLYVSRDQAVPLSETENFIADLIGCSLLTTTGQMIGRVVDVLQPGAADVYVVKTETGSLLVPALKHVILSVDVQRKLITADAERLEEVSLASD